MRSRDLANAPSPCRSPSPPVQRPPPDAALWRSELAPPQRRRRRRTRAAGGSSESSSGSCSGTGGGDRTVGDLPAACRICAARFRPGGQYSGGVRQAITPPATRRKLPSAGLTSLPSRPSISSPPTLAEAAAPKCKVKLDMSSLGFNSPKTHQWSHGAYRAFLDACIDLKDEGYFGRGHPDDEGYKQLMKQMKLRCDVEVTKEQVKNKFENTRRDWTRYNELKSMSGIGIDPNTGAIQAPAEWWKAYGKAYTKFKKTGLQHEDKLDQLYGDMSTARQPKRGGTGAPIHHIGDDSDEDRDMSARMEAQFTYHAGPSTIPQSRDLEASTGPRSTTSSGRKRRQPEINVDWQACWESHKKVFSGGTGRERPTDQSAQSPTEVDTWLAELVQQGVRQGSQDFRIAVYVLSRPEWWSGYRMTPGLEDRLEYLRFIYNEIKK